MMARQRMTGTQLAQELDVSQMWVSDRLRGVTPIDLNELELIASILGVAVLDLFPATHARSSAEHLAVLATSRPASNRAERRRLKSTPTREELPTRKSAAPIRVIERRPMVLRPPLAA